MKTLRVFCNAEGEFGNPVGVIEDLGKRINNKTRQHLAVTSGYSEIVFINDLENRSVSIFSPTGEIPFAGHAVVGIAYYLRHTLNLRFREINSMNKTIETWEKNKITWVKTDLSNLPDWNYKELKSPAEVESLTVDGARTFKHTFAWSWIDKEKGFVRARTFAYDWKIPEDEANGSGAIRLAHGLEREITIRHGKGSLIYATPDSVGGFVNKSS